MNITGPLKIFCKQTYMIAVLVIMFIITFGNNAFPDERYSANSPVGIRALGMGGACTAVYDDLAASIHNPAFLGLNNRDYNGFSFFVNPLGIAAVITDSDDLKHNSIDIIDAVHLFGSAVKGISFSQQFITSTLILSESLTDFSEPSGKFFSSDKLLDWNFDVFSTQFKFAEQFSIGASGFLFTTCFDKTERKGGLGYGIRLAPNPNFIIGVSYFDIPNEIVPFFITDFRILDETINVGITYLYKKNILVSLDIKNVTEENEVLTKEMHVGTEFYFSKYFTARSGYYYDQYRKQNVFSCGFGLFSNSMYEKEFFNLFLINLNYGLEIKKSEYRINQYHHLLSLLIKI